MWQNPDGNRNVPYLNRNADKRNLNLNWFDNDWDSNYRFAAVRNSLCFYAALCGVFFHQLSVPTAQHFADLVQFFRKVDIFLFVQPFDFPEDLQKEFY